MTGDGAAPGWRGDLTGGITAAVIALPLALAFGVASGLGPVAGLYGAICTGLFAALFGGTGSQVSGPTGPMTVVFASVYTQFGAEPAVAFTVVMMTGAFQVLFGWLRVGRYVNLMPYPVVSGFMTGIGCILLILQLEPLLGQPTAANVQNALTVLPEDLVAPNSLALLVGAAALACCLWTPRVVSRWVPPPLVALLAGTALAWWLGGVPLLGAVPSALPDWQVPTVDLALLNSMLLSALVLAALGSIDSLLTSLVADNMTQTFHDSDRELTGQGIGNIVAGLAGGLPGAGATVRTLANIKAGGRSRLSGATHALILLLVVLGFGPVAAVIPHAALAGILVKVGIDVIDWRFLGRLHRVPRGDAVVMLVVLVLTVFLDVVTAVGVGVVMASLLFVKQMADLQVAAIQVVGHDSDSPLLDAEEAALLAGCDGALAVLHLSGPMSFGAANEMMRRIAQVQQPRALVIDLTDVPAMDGSAAVTLEDVIQRARDIGQDIHVVGLQPRVASMLDRLGTLAGIRAAARHATRLAGIRAARDSLARNSEPAPPADIG